MDVVNENYARMGGKDRKMFNCEKCGKTSQPKEKCHIVPVKTKVKKYKCGSIGTEIVKEQKLCESCQRIAL